MVQPLIDGDIFCYEIGSVSQYFHETEKNEDGSPKLIIRPWDWVAETLDQRIKDICEAVGATQKPKMYLTGDEVLWKMKRRVRPSLPIYTPNFRVATATSKDYKGGRKAEKPYHYNNIRSYLVVAYDAYIAIGMEADDAMSIEQTRRFDPSHGDDYSNATTIICTRDKDLRQVPGWHYGWECGKQAEFGPHYYGSVGSISLDRSKKPPKITGGGFAFFCSQLITGDVVDNIGGLPKYGAVSVSKVLGSCTTRQEYLDAVVHEYKTVYPDSWKDRLREQCNLLWMVREYNEDGSLKMFNPKDIHG